MNRNRRRQIGITLPELMLVIGIVGVIAVVTIPNFNAFLRSYRASSAVNEMTATLNLARQLAVTRREVHQFDALAAPQNRWTLLNTVSGETVQEGKLPEGVAITVGAVFSFDTNGACTTPTTYVGTTPTTQYVRAESAIHSSRLDRFTVEVAPVGRVKTTREHLP